MLKLCNFQIQGAPHYSRVSDVVDLENETEVHSLIEFLKYFLRKDRQAKSAVVTDEKRDDGESRSGRRGGSAYNIVNGGDGGYVVEKEPEEPLIQGQWIKVKRRTNLYMLLLYTVLEKTIII